MIQEASDSLNAFQQLQLGATSGEIDTLLNSLRVSSGDPETGKMTIVNEMINDAGDKTGPISNRAIRSS